MKLESINSLILQPRKTMFIGFISYRFNFTQNMVKIKRVFRKRGKQRVVEQQASLVMLGNKICIAVQDTNFVECGDTLKVKSGDYFIGKKSIELINPLNIRGTDIAIIETNLEFRTINKSQLKDKHICKKIVNVGNITDMSINMKRVYSSTDKNIVEHFYGELVYFDNEDKLSILMPSRYMCNEHDVLRVTYYMGGREVKISNGRLLDSTNTAIYDIEYAD